MQPKNTLFLGKVLLHHQELDSTNEEAQNQLSKTQPAEGTVILTDYQKAGKGQMGQTWTSPAGENLTLSVILYPTFLPANQQFLLSQLTALAIRDFIAGLLPQEVTIKWPNDIFVAERKICGTLIQNAITGKTLLHAILGMGININTRSFPPEVARATSLALESGRTYDLMELLPDLFQRLEQRYLELKRGKYTDIRREYQQHLYRLQEDHLYQRADGTTFTGRLLGVNEQGQALIQHKDLEAFGLKEIRFL